MANNYAAMLEQEMAASNEFTQNNFGLMLGDEFPEMCAELMKIDSLMSQMFMRTALGALSLRGAVDEVAALPEGEKPNWSLLSRKNIKAFELPLSLFYWGVKVGRRLEAEQNRALSDLEKR